MPTSLAAVSTRIFRRSLPKGFGVKIERETVKVLPIFELIAERGNIPERDMFNTFNMGVGMTVIVAKEDADKTLEVLKAGGEDATYWAAW